MTVHRTRLHRTRTHSRPAYSTRLVAAAATLRDRLAADRGDVPGWVLITLMTAGIVVALWAVASDQIVQIFENAMAPFLGKNL